MNHLKNTQKWLQGVITDPDGIYKGAVNTPIDEKLWKVDSVVSPSKTLTSEERINIYHISYFARLIECFKAEYNGLLNALGEEMFHHFTWCFLQEHPSTSYTLNNLGKKFPEFLERTLSEDIENGSPDDWQLFILDMAKYERTFTEVFSGIGHENLFSDDIFGIQPAKLSPSVCTLQLKFPIADCIGNFRENDFNSFPETQITNYVFSRQRYFVRVHALGNTEFESLQNWIQSPNQDCPIAYRDSWRQKGIVYS